MTYPVSDHYDGERFSNPDLPRSLGSAELAASRRARGIADEAFRALHNGLTIRL